MKSTFISTIVLKPLSCVALSIGLTALTGCYCKTYFKRPVISQCYHAQCVEQVGHTKQPISKSEPNQPSAEKQVNQQPSGLVMVLRDIVAPGMARSTVVTTVSSESVLVSESNTEKNISSRRKVTSDESLPQKIATDKEAITNQLLANSGTEILTETAKVNSSPTGVVANAERNPVPLRVKPVQTTLDRLALAKIDLGASVNLTEGENVGDIGKTLASEKDLQPMVNVRRNSAMEPVKTEQSELGFRSASNNLAPYDPTPLVPSSLPSPTLVLQANTDNQSAPTSLPRARANSLLSTPGLDRFNHEQSDNHSIPADNSVSDNQDQIQHYDLANGQKQFRNPEQPLSLELRDRGWPAETEVDTVRRAYQIREEHKSHSNSGLRVPQTIADDLPPGQWRRNGTMQMIGHRRALSNLETSANQSLMDERLNWDSSRWPTPEVTGLSLSATPQSANVNLSPIVNLGPQKSHINSERPQTPSRAVKPNNALPTRDPYRPQELQEFLPSDEFNPIIDLPISNSIRRLTVRPEKSESETIDR